MWCADELYSLVAEDTTFTALSVSAGEGINCFAHSTLSESLANWHRARFPAHTSLAIVTPQERVCILLKSLYISLQGQVHPMTYCGHGKW